MCEKWITIVGNRQIVLFRTLTKKYYSNTIVYCSVFAENLHVSEYTQLQWIVELLQWIVVLLQWIVVLLQWIVVLLQWIVVNYSLLQHTAVFLKVNCSIFFYQGAITIVKFDKKLNKVVVLLILPNDRLDNIFFVQFSDILSFLLECDI